MGSIDLEALFDRYRESGDVDALAQVFDAAGPRLLKVARHLRAGRIEAEDLVQTTFLTAIEKTATWDRERPLLPWLMGILVNHARSTRRRSSREHAPQTLEAGVELDATRGAPSKSFDDPPDAAEAEEFARALAAAIQKLPESYRDVLVSYLSEGSKPHEIAERLNRPRGTVRAQLHRGLQMLRESLSAGFTLGGTWLGVRPPELASAREAVLHAARALATRRRNEPTSTSPPLPLAPTRALRWALPAVALLLVAGLWWAFAAREPAPVATASVRADASERAAELAASPVASARSGSTEASPTPSTALAASPDDPYGALRIKATYRDGAPAAHVGFQLMTWGHPQWDDHILVAVADERGEVLVERVHRGRVGLFSDRGGENRATVRAGEETLLEWKLPGEVEIRGRVVDSEGLPVPTASLWLSFGQGGRVGRAVAPCDAHGRFEVAHLHPYIVAGAVAPEFAASERIWIGSPSHLWTKEVELEFVLHRASGAIVGRARDEEGRPVPRPRVRVSRSATREYEARGDGSIATPMPPVETTGDDEGRFELRDLRRGDYFVQVSSLGRPDWHGVAFADEREPIALDVVFERALSIRGRLLLPDGAPASNARVTAEAACISGPWEGATDADGRFEIGALGGGRARLFAAEASGTCLPLEEHVTLARGADLEWTGTFAEARGIEGVLVDGSGVAIAGHRLRVVRDEALEGAPVSTTAEWLARCSPWSEERAKEWLSQKTTGADGSFTVKRIASGSYAIEVHDTDPVGPALACFRGIAAGARGVRLVLDASTRANAKVRGVLRRADGRAITGASVLTRQAGIGGESKTPIDPATGAFETRALVGGRVALFAWGDGLPLMPIGAFELAHAQTLDAGEIVIDAPGTLELVVRRADGSVPRDVDLALSHADGWRARASSAGDGIWRASDLRPGRWNVSIHANDLETRTRAVDVRAGTTERIEESLAPARMWRVAFSLPQDDAAERADAIECAILRDDTTLVVNRVVRAPDGAEIVLHEQLAPGTYAARVMLSPGVAASGEFTVPESASSSRTLHVRCR